MASEKSLRSWPYTQGVVAEFALLVVIVVIESRAIWQDRPLRIAVIRHSLICPAQLPCFCVKGECA
jgi:hypothetical protein